MIIELEKEPLFFLREPLVIERTESLLREIEENWKRFIKGKDPNDYYDGNIYTVTEVNIMDNTYALEIAETKYSHLVFASNKKNKICIRSLFVASYIVTKEGTCVIIKNSRGVLNTIGGMADRRDFLNNTFLHRNCLDREVREELGISLSDKEILYAVPKFLKVPMGDENVVASYPTGILYEIKSSYTEAELKEVFNSNRDYVDGEVDKLVFINSHNYMKLEQYKKKESYLPELFQKVFE